MVVAGPLEELELPDQHGLEPYALGHLRLRQPLTPASALLLRQVHERAAIDLQALELTKERGPAGGGEPCPGPGHVDEILALVVAEHQCVERRGSSRVAANHEFLTPIDAHLHPCARAKSGFVHTVPPL
jgi:hypothetical protein